MSSFVLGSMLAGGAAVADTSATKLSPLVSAASNRLDSVFDQCQDSAWQYYLPKRNDMVKDYPALLTTKDPYGKFGPVGAAIAACDAKMKSQNATTLTSDESAAERYVLDECKGSSRDYAKNRDAIYKKFPGIGSKMVKNAHNGNDWSGSLDENVKYCLSSIKAAEAKQNAEIAQDNAERKRISDRSAQELQQARDEQNSELVASQKAAAENLRQFNQKEADQNAAYQKYQNDLRAMVAGDRLNLLGKLGDPESLSDEVPHDHSAKSAAHAEAWSYSVARGPTTGRIRGNAGQSYEVKVEQKACVTWYHFQGNKISRTDKVNCN